MTRILPRVALAPFLFLTVAVGACSSPAAPTYADGVTPATNQSELRGTTLDHLQSANWDCQQRGPTFISCAPPGIGLPPIPSLGEDGRPLYHLAVFGLDGAPIGSAHFLRADLYHGQTCAFTGQPFVLRAIIGYYECLKPADGA